MGEEPTEPRGEDVAPAEDSEAKAAALPVDSGWVTTEVAAAALRVSPRTVRDYIRSGVLEAKSEVNGQTYGDGLDALAKLIRMRMGTANAGRSVGLGELHKVARLGMVAMFVMVSLTAYPRGLTAEELVEGTGRRRDHVISTMRKLQDL
jgi:hypothetical protein